MLLFIQTELTAQVMRSPSPWQRSTLAALLQFSRTMFIIFWASHSCRHRGDQQLRRGSNEMGLGLFFPWFTRLRDFESSVVLFCLFSLMTLISRVLWWDCAIAACKLRVCVRHQQCGCRRLARVSQDWRVDQAFCVGLPCSRGALHAFHPSSCLCVALCALYPSYLRPPYYVEQFCSVWTTSSLSANWITFLSVQLSSQQATFFRLSRSCMFSWSKFVKLK